MIVLAAIVIGCFSLGVWQIDRYAQKKQLNDTPSQTRELEIIELVDAEDTERLLGKTVTIAGEFLPDSVVKLDNRMVDSIYGVDVFALFREQSSSKVYPVNMGWLQVGNDRNKLAHEFDFSGITRLQAMIGNVPSRPPFVSDDGFRDAKHDDLWLFVNITHLSQLHGTPIEILALNHMQPVEGLRYREMSRENNAIMHILYAIQWFLFSLFALFGFMKIYK